MIRLRSTNGQVLPIPADGTFVEIVNDEDGSIGLVFFQVPGMIIQVQPGSQDAHRYEQMFAKQGVKFNKTLIHRR